MNKLIAQIDSYKNNIITKDELKDVLVNHISRLNIEFLEDRFGKVENIGNMLGFYEVADAIYDYIPDLMLSNETTSCLKVGKLEAIKLLFSPKLDITNKIERAIGRIRDLHDRKKLSTIRYEITFRDLSGQQLFHSEGLKVLKDKIVTVEKKERISIVYSYTDILSDLKDLVSNIDCKLREI